VDDIDVIQAFSFLVPVFRRAGGRFDVVRALSFLVPVFRGAGGLY
jgi:hypothetical protein